MISNKRRFVDDMSDAAVSLNLRIVFLDVLGIDDECIRFAIGLL